MGACQRMPNAAIPYKRCRFNLPPAETLGHLYYNIGKTFVQIQTPSRYANSSHQKRCRSIYVPMAVDCDNILKIVEEEVALHELINLYVNQNDRSNLIKARFIEACKSRGIKVSRTYNASADYNVVIGGDGSFLRAVHTTSFSTIPFFGINTGHLGFYQEVSADRIEEYLDRLQQKDFRTDTLGLLQAKVETHAWTYELNAVNEFTIQTNDKHILHLDIYFDGIHLESVAGDGVILSTPSGSTAYNLAAGGAILYQTLEGYQFAPLADIQSKEYRSLPGSIVVPSTSVCEVIPRVSERDGLTITADGFRQKYLEIHKVTITVPKTAIQRIVFEPNWYWLNLKDKFL